MTRENKQHLLYPKISDKEKKSIRSNYKKFLKRHKEPEFEFGLKKG